METKTTTKRPSLRAMFYYLENSEQVRKKEFNKLLHRLDKPLFKMEELE